eukprot:3038407-Pleurochrysis_carterae.AAC.2
MPLKRSRKLGLICSASQMPPEGGRNSAAWLRVAAAMIAENKAAETKRSTAASPAASSRMLNMSRGARRARAVSFSSRTPSTHNELKRSVDHSRRRGSSLLEAGESRRPYLWQHVEDVRVGADCAQQHPEGRLADEGHRAHRSHDALGAEAGEERTAQFPASLSAQTGLFLQVSAQAAGLRETLGDGCIDEEDVEVARAADGQHVLDKAEQLVVEGLFLLALELQVEPLPKLRADGVALGRVEGDGLKH